MTTRHERISHLLQILQPQQLEIHDDSHLHAGHNPVAKEGGTHLRLDIISAQFSGKSRLERHRMVQALLKPEFDSGLHALQITARTLEENDASRP